MNTNDYRVKAIKDDWERIRKQFLAHAEASQGRVPESDLSYFVEEVEWADEHNV